jgi:zinc/manganese transport system substrate-binding protein
MPSALVSRVLGIALLLGGAPAGAAAALRVVATTPDLGAIATAVGGEAVEVTALARSGEDPHFVDPKPSFIVTLNKADVLVEGGAALEAGWLPPLLDAARNPRIAVGQPGRVAASDGLDLLDVPARLDRTLGDVHPYGNPHYLLDPMNAKTVATTIGRALCAVDGARCATYEEGARRFGAAVDERLASWQATLGPARGMRIVTYHKNFDYFAQRFGLEVLGTLEPKPGIPPSPTHLAELVPRMQAAAVRLILVETYRERDTPDFVAEKSGARVVVLPIMPGTRDAPDYLGLIDYIVRKVAEATRP